MERVYYHSENLVGLLSTKLAVQSLTMHSSGITGGFSGPRMHYHRRAESAPALDAIDRSRFGFPRSGSDPAMAIEEEEKEEEDDEAVANAAPTQIGLGVNIVGAASMHDEPIQRRRRRTKSVTNLAHAVLYNLNVTHKA